MLGQYSGSHYEMNNQATIELATANKNTLVGNDYYETVNGFRNEFTQKDFDEIVLRDKYKKVGNLDRASFQEWKDIVGPIQEFKQLFEIKRTGNNDVRSPDGYVTLSRNSDLKVGKWSPRARWSSELELRACDRLAGAPSWLKWQQKLKKL